MSDLAQARPASAPADDTITLDDALKFAALVLAGSWIGYFFFAGMPQLSVDVFPRTIAMHALFAVVAAVYVIYLLVARRLPGGSPLDLPVLAFIGAYAIATVASVSWRASLETTLVTGAAIIAFYALSDLPYLNATQLRRIALLAGGAVSLYAVWIVGNDYANYLDYVSAIEGVDSGNIFPPTVPRVHDVSDHPNVLAMLLTLLMPLFAITAYRAPSRWERIGGLVAMIAGGLAIFLTLSRGGWLGVIVGVAFTVVGAWLTVRAHDREQQGFAPSWENIIPRDISPTALAAIGGALVLMAGGTLAYLSSSDTRPGWLFRSSLSPREDAWRAGLDIFQDYPLAGAGPNAFGLLYPAYQGKFLVHTQHAHNGFLQVADDAGLLGLLALAAIAVAVVYMLLRTWREAALEGRLLAVACAGGLIGFSLHNQLDAGNIWKSPAIGLALVGAIIVRNYRERERCNAAAAPPASARIAFMERVPEQYRRYGMLAARSALLALLFVPFIAWARIDAAHYDYWRGMDDAANFQPGAIAKIQEAVNADGSMAPYQLQLGKLQAEAYVATNRTNDELIDNAIIHLERAAELDPRSDIIRANLARAYELKGRDEDAAREAQTTRLAIYHVPSVLVAGEVYEDLGREDDAISTYGQVISMDAGLADSTFWQENEWRRQRFDDIIAASALGANPCTLGAYMVEARRIDSTTADTSRLDDAEEGCKILVVNFPNDLVIRVALAKILLTNGKPDEAFIHLDYAVNRQPDFGPVRTELGRWYAARGDMETARHHWLVGGQLEETESLVLLGDTYPAGEVPRDLRERLSTLLSNSGTSIQNDLISILYWRLRYGRSSPRYGYIATSQTDWQDAVPRSYALMRETLARWNRAAPGGAR